MKNNFDKELIDRFPKISDDLGSFFENPKRKGFVIKSLRRGIKHDLLYYVITDKRLDLTNMHSFNPSYIYQVVGQVLVTKSLYDIDIEEIRSFFQYDIEGSGAKLSGEPLHVGIDNQEDQDHVAISIGYSSCIDFPKNCSSLQSKMKRLTKLIHHQRIRKIRR